MTSTCSNQNSTRIKKRHSFNNYIIGFFVTILLLIFNRIIFLDDFRFATNTLTILEKSSSNNELKQIETTTNTTKDNKIMSTLENFPFKQLRKLNTTENYIPKSNNQNLVNISTSDDNQQQSVFTRKKRQINNDFTDTIKCYNRDYRSEILHRDNYWILKNYIRAGHGELKCYEAVTYTTHAHYLFLDRLVPLVENWRAPISLALFTPHMQLQQTLDTILYLRNCLTESPLIRQFVTFHIYLQIKLTSNNIPKADELEKINCNLPSPFIPLNIESIYTAFERFRYPVNIGRNIARDAAQTHFILDSDIDLYPSISLADNFLKMISIINNKLDTNPRVFILPVFQVKDINDYPKTKKDLQFLIKSQKAFVFNDRVCPNCVSPNYVKWIEEEETNQLDVSKEPKYSGKYSNWQPIYIGTHNDPGFDERLSWEGKTENALQTYLLCLLNYNFYIFNNAFLVHKPNREVFIRNEKYIEIKAHELINDTIYPELEKIYGTREECKLY